MKYTFSKDTKTFKVFTALKSGERLTQAEASKRFGVGNLAAEASRIRSNGYAVYARSRVAGNGVKVVEYELGNASREIVALGYKAKQMGITL
jgi:Helix-turn-helix domain